MNNSEQTLLQLHPLSSQVLCLNTHDDSIYQNNELIKPMNHQPLIEYTFIRPVIANLRTSNRLSITRSAKLWMTSVGISSK